MQLHEHVQFSQYWFTVQLGRAVMYSTAQARDIQQRLVEGWASNADVGPTLNKPNVNVM